MVRDRIKEFMEKRSMKVGQLAFHAEVSDAAIYNILNGADPKLSTIARIARAFGISTCELIDEDQREGFLEDRGKLEALGMMAA